MTARRIPHWLIWAGLTIAAWVVWFVVLRGPLTTATARLQQDADATERRLNMYKARLADVPAFVSALDSTYEALDNAGRTVARVAHLDRLISDLRASGFSRGLSDVMAEPDLGSLLTLGSQPIDGPTPDIHLDTLLIELAATADFISTGQWMDDIESRPDFQQWVECHWTDADGEGTVRFQADVALLVINAPDAFERGMDLTDGQD